MSDDNTHIVTQLAGLQTEVAALVRQYGRAADAADDTAQEVEVRAVCSRINWLLYHHLDLRIGMGSDDWVWLDGVEDCMVERRGRHDLWARGRIWCSLPEGRRRWTEPFAADIRHSPTTAELCGYTVWFANRATMLDLTAMRHLVAEGEPLAPRPPDHEDGWAFVFRMGEAE